jgi:type IX secretion system substrate protein/HYDIN/CFA65/VesB family protein
MKIINKCFIVLLFLSFNSFGQTGPVDGSVASGVVVTTDDYSKDAPVTGGKFKLFNKFQENIIQVAPDASERNNFVLDPIYANSKVNATLDSLIVFESFDGIPQGNSIPPDPYIAVGPNHVIQTVNSTFRITDKEGNTLKTISADQWFSNTVPGSYTENTFDPKVTYDHFSNRWVMVWLDSQTSTSYFLISVSDDENPLGTWFNWALPSNVNGTTPIGSWGDYQGVGYDDQAIYITSNQFFFSGGYQYAKLRIIDKNDLYAATAGQLNFRDFYSINDFGIRPSRSYDASSSEYYLLAASTGGGTAVALYKLTDPLGATASLTKVNVPCNFYLPPPDTDQLGGGSPSIDDGGSGIRNEPVYRDGILHAVHAVRNGVTTSKSSVRYLAIDPTTNTTVRDIAMGTPEHYHNYPALAVAKNNDVVLTYSRSASTEYMGAYYTILKAGAASPLGSITLQEGKANYVKTFSGTRNRWGDYMGAWTDPADENSFWIYTEYVTAPNTWANWVGGVRIIPYDDAYIFTDKKVLDFGDNEVSTTSSTINVIVRNFGDPDLTITNIQNSNSEFSLLTSLSLPITLSSYDSLTLEYEYAPAVEGAATDSVVISSNDPDDADKYIALAGYGYIINQVEAGKLYGLTSTQVGELLTIDTTSALGTAIGSSPINDPYAMAISPVSKQIYVLTEEDDNTSQVFRINSTVGDAFYHFSLPSVFDAITFSDDDTLYAVSADQKLYTIHPVEGTTNYVADVGIKVSAIAINRVNGELWAAVDATSDKDRLYKIDKTNGDTTLVGKTGKSRITESLAFDTEGNLFATSIFLQTYLHKINTVTGEATDVGKISGFTRVKGIEFSPDPITVDIEDEVAIPAEFALNQNYPNPFNPSTKITFSLPVSSEVRLSIVDLLGQEIAILKNEVMNAGTHTVDWNAGSQNISNMSSGVYFYRIKAVGNNGKEFNSTMKMMLLK